MLDEDEDDEDYRPLHPFREAVTIGACLLLVAAIFVWLAMKVLG